MNKGIATYEIKWTGNNFEDFTRFSIVALIEMTTCFNGSCNDNSLMTIRPYNSGIAITLSVGSSLVVEVREDGRCYFAIRGVELK